MAAASVMHGVPGEVCVRGVARKWWWYVARTKLGTMRLFRGSFLVSEVLCVDTGDPSRVHGEIGQHVKLPIPGEVWIAGDVKRSLFDLVPGGAPVVEGADLP